MTQRAAMLTVAAMALAAAQATSGQGPAPNALKFEVATIKPTPPDVRSGGIRPAPGGERYRAVGMPLKALIMVAYRVKIDQIIGGPSWVDTQPWDMDAKAERPSSADELHMMLQNLMAERFKLQLHKSTKELPVYVLSVDKDGPKLTPHEAQSAGDPWIDQSFEQIVHVKMSARFCPMEYFAWRLAQLLDRPVVDRTALKGGYDFQLAFTRELPPGVKEGALLNGSPIETSGPTIFEALRKQLGLRLDAQKGPVDVIVIDHVEKPTEN